MNDDANSPGSGGSGSGTGGGVRMADLISEPGDIPDLREHIKHLAKSARDRGEDVTVDDYLAQSRKNDAAYIAPADLEKAEWIAGIYESEGCPEIHPRDFHYQILGKGYELRNGEPYSNSNAAWNELKEAFKWARILGLIDSENIEDAENPDATPTAFEDVDRPLPDAGERQTVDAAYGIEVDDGYRRAAIPQEIDLAHTRFEDVDEFIATSARLVADHTFERIYFDATTEQRYYIEIWSEKSGVIPESLAGEYGATIREAGKGEFSLSMCEEAIEIASKRNQDLALIIVSDFDPKGADMPVSAGRKLEVLGALDGVEVELTQGAVTKEQVETYGIPGDPARVPDGLERGVRGAKGYETQKELFREYAGQYPVEIQGFTTTHPDAFENELKQRLRAYHDTDLGDRIKENVTQAREEARRVLVDAFEDRREEIQAALSDLHQGIDRYQSRLEGDVDGAKTGLEMLADRERTVRDDEKIDALREGLVETISQVDHHDVLAGVDVTLPEPDTTGVSNPVLDTRRAFMDQLESYREYNMRYE